MKKIFKSKIFWIILVILIVVGGFVFGQGGKNNKEEVVTAMVAKGDLKQTVSATGKVESASETNLNFSASGKIKKIYIKAGDQVAEGQLLAELEAQSAQSAVAQARANVLAAQADLDRIKAGASSEDIAVSESQVKSAETTLASAKTALTNALADRDQGLTNAKKSLIDAISDALFNMKLALNTVDEMLDDYPNELGNINRSTYFNADSAYDLTLEDVNEVEADFSAYSIADSKESLIVFSLQATTALTSVDDLLDKAYQMLLSTVPISSLTQTIIDSYKTDIDTDQTTIVTKISSVQSAKSNLESYDVTYQKAIDVAHGSVDKAEKDLALAEAQLELKKAGARDFEIDLYQAKLVSAQANLGQAQAELENYLIKSPIKGLVTKVNYEIGEVVNASQPVISIIGESNLEIKVDVPESDISKIKVGDLAEITLDAFGDDQIFNGHLTFIDPAETIINDVVYYKVKVTFDNKEENVKSGMTANVTISSASRQGVLYIPLRAVIEKNGRKIVRLMVDEQVIEREVTIGLKADDGFVEVTSGLNEGETIITFIEQQK